MKVLLATTNKSKIRYYGQRLIENGVDVITLNDLDKKLDIDENGKKPVENAIIKARAYGKISNLPTVALDDGLFLNNLPDEIQPKTHVRRVNGKRLNDDEMVNYYIDLVEKYGENGILNGFFLKGVCVYYDGSIYSYEKKSNRCFTSKKSDILKEGYPLSSIQYVKELGKYKSELTYEEEKQIKEFEEKDIIDFILNSLNSLKL